MSQQNELPLLSIVVADDHPVFRHGLRQIIDGEQGLYIVGEADSGDSALDMIQKVKPSIAILDVAMPKLDGLAVARYLQAERLPVKIIFLTMYREERLFREALKAGVKGYVLKDSAASDIISCIRAVAAEHNYVSPEFTTYLVGRVRQVDAAHVSRSGLEVLTPAELRVLSLIAEYKTTKEIAEALFISPRTVETHRHNICRKLEVHGSHALMKFSLAHKTNLSSGLTST